MKKISFITFVISALIVGASTLSAQTATEITAKFGEFSLESDTLNIKGRLFVPESYVPEEEYPVVLTLAGSGERGTDNNIQVLVNHLATSWGTDEFQAEHPCFIFSPQCPAGLNWSMQDVYQSVMILLDSLIEKYSIDTTRIYVTGLSLGGYGTYYYMYFDPDKYAAGIPVCGGLWQSKAENRAVTEAIRHIPVWDFHGGTDDVVPTALSREIMTYFKDLDQVPLFTNAYGRLDFDLTDEVIEDYIDSHVDLLYSEIRGVGHFVWDIAYQTPLAKEWLFQQRLRLPESIVVDKTGETVKVTGSKEFSYTLSDQVDSVGVWYGKLDTAYMEFVDGMRPVKGSFTFDSEAYDDFPYSILKFLAFDAEGNVIGKDYSDVICINNEGNAPPYIELLNDVALIKNYLLFDEYTMQLKLGDPESDPLHITFEFSLDTGASFDTFAEDDTEEGIYEQLITFYDFYLPDETMVIRASVTDGEYTSSVQTLDFKNKYGYINSILPMEANNFRTYPNPASDFLNLEFDAIGSGQLEIKLISMDGRITEKLVQEEIAAGKVSYTFPINEVNTGSYLLLLSMDGKNQLSKLVVIE